MSKHFPAALPRKSPWNGWGDYSVGGVIKQQVVIKYIFSPWVLWLICGLKMTTALFSIPLETARLFTERGLEAAQMMVNFSMARNAEDLISATGLKQLTVNARSPKSSARVLDMSRLSRLGASPLQPSSLHQDPFKMPSSCKSTDASFPSRIQLN